MLELPTLYHMKLFQQLLSQMTNWENEGLMPKIVKWFTHIDVEKMASLEEKTTG